MCSCARPHVRGVVSPCTGIRWHGHSAVGHALGYRHNMSSHASVSSAGALQRAVRSSRRTTLSGSWSRWPRAVSVLGHVIMLGEHASCFTKGVPATPDPHTQAALVAPDAPQHCWPCKTYAMTTMSAWIQPEVPDDSQTGWQQGGVPRLELDCSCQAHKHAAACISCEAAGRQVTHVMHALDIMPCRFVACDGGRSPYHAFMPQRDA